MIVVLKRGVEEKKRAQLIGWLKNQGLGVHISEGEYQTVLGLIGDTTHIDMDLIASRGIVDSVTRVTEPFKCCNRKFHPDDTVVEVGDVTVPLTDSIVLPDEAVPLADSVMIPDEDVPLADSVPQTGDDALSVLPGLTAGLAAIAGALRLRRKERE